ncbi:phage tail tape measure protein [Halopseudomonas laoshanensis]|uniref:phage tail tape measure protein n=1 Tax=Halopseudomonas laoshanensis TaxID=2268758 RepID=UPI003734DAB1
MATKSLGTLTLDMVVRTGSFVQGMDKASRETAKWRKQAEKDAKAIGKAIGVGFGIASAASVALVASTVKSANEISRLAQVSNMSTDAFQRNAAGAKVMGVEQQKLADIYKDINDKLGDFMQTGAGPLADFFEQVAPQIGVTAEQFRNLSGPDALQFYVSSLEKANVSQNDMTFYMEAIASDATLLLPLLRDNGAGFKLLGDEAARAGAILDNETITSAEQMTAAMFVMDQTVAGMKNQIAGELVPTLADMAAGLSDVTVDGAIAEDMGRVLSGTIKGLAASAIGGFAALQLLAKGIAGIAVVADAATEGNWYESVIPPLLARRIYKNWGDAKTALDVVGDDLDDTAMRYGEMLNNIWAAGDDSAGSGDGDSRIEQIALFLRQAREAAGQAGGDFRALGKDFDKAGKDAEKAADNIRNQMTALEVAAETWGMAAGEVKLYTLEQDGASESDLARARSLIEVVDNLELTKKAQEDYADLLKDLRTDEEVLTDQMRERLAVLDAMSGLTDDQRANTAGRIAGAATEDAPEYGGLDAAVGGAFGELQKIDEAEEKLSEWYATQLEMLEQFRQERADLNATWDEEERAVKQEHEDELARIERARQMAQLAATESVFGSLTDIAGTFAGEQSGIYKAMFAIQKAAAIAQSLVAIQTGVALAAANPFPMNLAAMASVAAATAGLVSNIASIGLDGQAHDGIMSVPADGTWNLKKGERVTTAETSAKLDATLERIGNESRGGTGNVVIQNFGNNKVRTERDPSGDLKVIIEAVEMHLSSGIMRGQGKLNTAIKHSLRAPRKIS